MAIKRRRYDEDSSQAAGLDYLLRRAARLDSELPAPVLAGDRDEFAGPIEVTYLVASVDARPEIRAVADFVCSGVDDEVEIQAALDSLSAVGGRVVLSAGRFYVGVGDHAVTIAVPANAHLQGAGAHATWFEVGSPSFDFQITYTWGSELSDFGIAAAEGG